MNEEKEKTGPLNVYSSSSLLPFLPLDLRSSCSAAMSWESNQKNEYATSEIVGKKAVGPHMFDFSYCDAFIPRNLRRAADSTHQPHHGYIFPTNNQKTQAFVSVLAMTVCKTEELMIISRYKRKILRVRTISPHNFQA